jgi:hypothetical protein
VTRSAATTLLAALRKSPPSWAVEALGELRVIELAEAHGILPVIAEIAARHSVIPLSTASALPQRRDSLSPKGVLLAARQDSRERHQDLDAIRRDAERVLRDQGVPYRHLKGGALRELGVWADFTARPTRDVDILVGDPLAIPGIEDALIAEGFRRSDEIVHSRAWQDDHHDLPLVHHDRAGSLELHAASLVMRHRDRISLDLAATGDDPDLVTTLRHIIIHAQFQDDALLQWRLPIVSLLDVAFALESGLTTSAALLDGLDDRSTRRAIRIHLGLAGRLRGTRFAGSAWTAARWTVSAWLFGRPRAAHLVREAAFAPRSLSRPVMTARAGRPLRGSELARARIGFLRERVPRGARAAPRSAGRSRMRPEERVGPMVFGTGTGANDVDAQISWDATPAKAEGFEAVWSSSGLVLVDLDKDVLHHLNEPAAVVYDLVGDRSAARIADAFADLAGVPDSDARAAVGAALSGLGAIGAIRNWSSVSSAG